MPLYQIEAPDGKTYEIEGPPGATKEQVAQAVIAKLGRVPEPQTVGGHVKELFKGPIPGAIGALESAVTGAAAMLPEGAEQAVRGVASKTAAALKAPFAAAPGYEDAYSRKVGEGVGSVLPYLAAGPFGAAGRVAASGVAVAQGAGEARTRAEQDGATDEQRRMATLAGAPVGLLEMAPVERMFRTLGEPIKRAVVDRVKRAMSTGGIEAAQEAASSALQNLIAQNVYKPEQEIVEGVGEAAGVGAGTGVLVQGLLDLALGKRAGRGAGAPTGEDKTKRDAILAELRAQEEAQQQQTAQQEAAKASPQYLVEQSAKLQALEEQQAALKAQLNPKPETALDRATNADIKRQLQELGAEAKQIATEIAPRRAELAELQRVQAEAEQARTEQAAAAAQGTAAAPVDNAAPGVMAYPPGTQMGLDGSAVVARPTPSTQPTTEEALRQRLSLEQQERALHAHLQDVDQEISIAAQERDIDLLDRLVQGRGQTAQALSAAQEQLRGMPPPPPTEARSDPLERLYKQLQKAGEEGDTDRVATLVAKIKAAGAAPAQPQTLDLLSKENMRATEDANARLQPRPPLSASDRAMMLERQSDAAANNEALLGVSRQDALRQQIMDARSQALDPNRAQGLLAGQRNETNDDLLAQGRERGATREVAEREARKQAFEARTMSTSVVEQGLLPFADAQGQQPKTRDDLLADLKEARKAKDITAAQRAIDALRKQADAARTPPTLASALYKYQQGTATKDDILDALQKLPRAEQERFAEALPYSQIWLGDTAQAAYHAAKELGLKAPPPRGEATRGIQGQLSQAVPADVMQKQQTGAAPTVERVSTATVAYPYTAQPTPPPSNDATEAIAAQQRAASSETGVELPGLATAVEQAKQAASGGGRQAVEQAKVDANGAQERLQAAQRAGAPQDVAAAQQAVQETRERLQAAEAALSQTPDDVSLIERLVGDGELRALPRGVQEDLAEFAHGLRMRTPSPVVRQRLEIAAGELEREREQAKRSETEQVREKRAGVVQADGKPRTAFTPTGGVETAVQQTLDLPVPEGEVDYDAVVFDTQEQFEAYLAGDAVQEMRVALGKAFANAARARQLAAPLQQKYNELKQSLDKILAARDAEMSRLGVGLAKAEAGVGTAKSKLQAQIDAVEAKLAPLRKELAQAQEQLQKALTKSWQMHDRITRNAAKFYKDERVIKASFEVYRTAREEAQLLAQMQNANPQAPEYVLAAQRRLQWALENRQAAEDSQDRARSADAAQRVSRRLEQLSEAEARWATERATLDTRYKKATAATLAAKKKLEGLLQTPEAAALRAFERADLALHLKLDDAVRAVNAQQELVTQAQQALDNAKAEVADRNYSRRVKYHEGRVADAQTRVAELREQMAVLLATSREDTALLLPQLDAIRAEIRDWLEPASLAGEARVRTNKTVPQARAQLRAEKDAAQRQRETNQRNSALETMRTGLPGELVEFQDTAREQLARALDGIDEKIAAKEADAADETLPKTTRDKRNRDLGVLRTLKDIAGDATTGDAESIQRAVDAAMTERQTLADKMAKQNASYLEAKEAVDAARRADTKESTPETTAALEAAVKLRDSRMRERNKTRRSLAHFDAAVGILSSAPKRTTLLTAEERREEAERANRVVPGTRLAPRVIGPTVREQSAAPGVMRTGELLTAGARAAPPQRPITQAGRRKGVSAKQAVAQANKDVEIEQLTLELQEREALKEKAQAALAKAKTPEAKAKYTEFTQRLQRRINTIEVRLEELETAEVGPSTTAQRAAKEADGEIQYSKEPSGGGMTAQQFQQELKGSGLELNPRKVTVVDSVNDLPTALRDRVVKESRDGAVPTAFVYKDRAYFIAGNIGKGKALSKVLHEIGAHLGMENILSAAQRDVLVNKVLEWAARNDGSAETRIAKAAVARVVAAGVDADQRSDEIVAYFIEEAVNAGVKPTALPSGQATGGWSAARWLRTVYAAFKAAVRRLGWMNADGLQAQHVVDMAYGAARLELSGTWHGTAAQFRKFNHKFMGSGEGAQAFGWGTYLAQSLGIAKGYWVADVRRKDAKNYEDAQETVRQLKAELGRLEERDRMGEGVEEDLGAKRKSLAEAVAYAGGLTKPEGALMRVDVLVDQDEMLDWDKPLSEQSETVKDALPPALVKEHGSKTGKDVYRYYAGNMDSTRSYKEASKKLYAMGIKGVKVLDAKSRELPGELRAAQTRVARLQKSAGAAQAKIARDGAPDGTWHAENFADLHAAEAALREVEQRMSEATRNLVVFNDKDIVRVASLRGADKERVQFSKEPGNPVEDLAGVLLATKKPLKGRIAVNLGLAGRTQAVDALAPIEAVAQSQMESLQGLQVMYDSRMYGQRSAFTAQVMNHGPLEYATKKRDDGRTETLIESREGPTLRMVAQTLAEGPLGDADKANRYFSVYTIAQRAKRVGLDRLDLSGGVTQPMIDAAMAEIKATPGLEQNFKDAYALYNAYNKGLIRFLEKSGAVSKDSAAKMLASNDYVPFYRERGGNVELLIGGEAPIRIGNMKDQPYLQELRGGDEKVLDFLTSSVRNTSLLVDLALRNNATASVANSLQDVGLAQVREGDGPMGPTTLRFKYNGDAYHAIVDTDSVGIPADLLVKGMAGIPTQMPSLVKAIGIPAKLLRQFVVLNPLYSARQLFRDSTAAAIASGANLTPVLSSIKHLSRTESRETLESRGITGGQVLQGTADDMTALLRGITAGGSPMLSLAKWESASMAADAATRAAQYDSYRKQGLSELEATFMALESMNFNRRGVSANVHWVSHMVPFFNAQIQGLDVLYRAFRGRMPMQERLQIREKLLKRGALLMATSMAYALAMQDDEAYKNATPEERAANFFVPLPGVDEAVRIPIPFEIGYIFKALPEMVLNMALREDGTTEAKKALNAIILQTIPGGSSMPTVDVRGANVPIPIILPTAVKPAVELALGKSFYTRRDIESEAEQSLEAKYRYRDTTSELAKTLGSVTGVSPIMVENTVRGYTSGLGVALMQAFSFAMPTADGPEAAAKTLSKLPIVGPAFQPADGSGVLNLTYDRIKEIEQTKRTYEQLVKRGERAEAERYLQEKADTLALASAGGNVKQMLGKLTQLEAAVRASDMSPVEKREMLIAVRQQKLMLAEAGRSALR